MANTVFKYCCRELYIQDIHFIRALIAKYYTRGRSYISRVLCQAWQWIQPNGKLKECADRDLLLGLEEKGFIKLPPRLKSKNNLKNKSFNQIPLFSKDPLEGSTGDYDDLSNSYLWDYLVQRYHYLGRPKLVGEDLRHLVYIDSQVMACLAWASAAWKIKNRDRFAGWDEPTRRKKLHLIANNTKFLVPGSG